MYEKVNPQHPDKIADRIAGAIVDLAYAKEKDPRVAVEVLLGHEVCHIMAETSVHFDISEIANIVKRLAPKLTVDYLEVKQDPILAENQRVYYCSASRPTIESQTNEDEIEVKTEKLTIKAAPLGNGLVKAKTGDDTNDEVYLNWYSEVYLPNAVIGGEAEFIAMQD